MPTKIIMYLVGIALIVGALYLVHRDGYKNGKADCEQTHEEVLKKVNAANADLQSRLDDTTKAYGEAHARAIADNRAKDQVIVDRIETRIVEQAACEIDPEIIRLRNEMRDK